MRRGSRAVVASLLVLLATALVLGIAALYSWGGRIETLLLLFGDRVWVTLDAGRPRILLLLLAPGVMVLAALSLYRRSRG